MKNWELLVRHLLLRLWLQLLTLFLCAGTHYYHFAQHLIVRHQSYTDNPLIRDIYFLSFISYIADLKCTIRVGNKDRKISVYICDASILSTFYLNRSAY